MTDSFARRLGAALSAWDTSASMPTSALTGTGAVAVAERALAAATKASHALLVSSGTAALRTALLAVGVRPGDAVLMSALDWPAASAAAHSIGAVPVYADVDLTGTLDPGMVARSMGAQTAAVVATHLFGYPADIPAIREAVGGAVPIIEDAAPALGASRGGVPVGSLGDVACFSFGPGKLVDAGEGGAVTTSSEQYWAALVAGSQHPLRQSILGIDVSQGFALHARPHPAMALMAVGPLRQLESLLEHRHRHHQGLARRLFLADLPVELPPLDPPPIADPVPDRLWGCLPVDATVEDLDSAAAVHGLALDPIPLSAPLRSPETLIGSTNASWLCNRGVVVTAAEPGPTP